MTVGDAVVVLHCAEGARKALDAMARAGLRLPEGVRTFEMECSGRVNDVLLMETLENGVRGVIVVGCRKENCRYLDGNQRAGMRIDRVKRMLEDIGVRDKFVEMVYIAPDEGRRLHGLIERACHGAPA